MSDQTSDNEKVIDAGTDKKHVFKFSEPEGFLSWMDGLPVVETPISLIDELGDELHQTETDENGYFDYGGHRGELFAVELLENPEQEERVLHAQVYSADSSGPLKNADFTYTEFGEAKSAQADEEGIITVEGLTDHFYAVACEEGGFLLTTYSKKEFEDEIAPRKVWLGESALPLFSDPDTHDHGVESDGDEEDYWEDCDGSAESEEEGPVLDWELESLDEEGGVVPPEPIPAAWLPSAADSRMLQGYLVGTLPGLHHTGYDLGGSGPNGDGVDGIVGEKSKRGVKAFQEDHGGLQPDGIYGPLTRAAFDQEINQ